MGGCTTQNKILAIMLSQPCFQIEDLQIDYQCSTRSVMCEVTGWEEDLCFKGSAACWEGVHGPASAVDQEEDLCSFSQEVVCSKGFTCQEEVHVPASVTDLVEVHVLAFISQEEVHVDHCQERPDFCD